MEKEEIHRYFIEEHFEAIENILKADFVLSKNSFHTVIKGNVRESFIREFLTNYLSPNFEFGTGHVVHSSTLTKALLPGEEAQIDVIIHDRNMPKLPYSKDANAYLVESIPCIIEVKSELNRKGLRRAVEVTRDIKNFPRHHQEARIDSRRISGYIPFRKKSFY